MSSPALRIPAFAVVGYKNTGKTVLVTRLLSELRKRGYRVGTLKHDAHEFHMDWPGTDTDMHRQAGADVVAISGCSGWAVQAWEPAPPAVWDMLSRIQGVDLVLVEGYKHEPLPKIVLTDQHGTIFTIENLVNVMAVASIESGASMLATPAVPVLATPAVPVYDRNEIGLFADLIQSRLD